MNTAEYLIKQLEKLGITDIFGIAGDYNLNILKAIEKNNEISWIGCTNELNAGYAADGYARVRGYGAIITTYGVGELSAMNAIAGSFAENVPVLHITGVPESTVIDETKIVHHGFYEPKPYAYIDAYKNVTEYACFLNKDNAKIEIDKALKIFVKEKKPVYIAIPSDIAVMKISEKDTDYEWYSDFDTLQTVVNKITEKINHASNPVLLGDVLVKHFHSESQFRDFAKSSGIPAANFISGAGIVDSDLPNYIGTYFGEFENIALRKALVTTDCLISAGVICSDVNSYGASLPYDIRSHIAIYGTYTYIDGIKYENVKMSDVFERITKKIQKNSFEPVSKYNGYTKIEAKNEQLSSNYIYPRLQEFFKPDDIVITETGTIPQGLFPIKFPNSINILSQMLWCSIGWALPAAFGAGIANPEKRIIVLTGDGAHQISAMEIGNIFKHKQKPVIIVFNNDGYTIERELSKEPEAEYNNIPQMNYTKFARSFKSDIWTAKVETDEDFDKALRVTQIMDKLCYIEAVTDKLDLPEFAQKVFRNSSLTQKNKLGLTENNKNKKSKKDIEYKTLIHTSLKEFEE